MAELTEQERALLDMEGRWFRFAGSKADAVRGAFGLSLTAYYQQVNALLDTPRALAYAPATVYRLRRLRQRRQAASERRTTGAG